MQNTDVLERDESTRSTTPEHARQAPPAAADASDASDLTPAPCTNGAPSHAATRNGDDAPDDAAGTPAGPPNKRRKLDDSGRSSRPPSPPWRRVEAEGPTSFMVDGKRRSGRMNTMPVELSPAPPDTKRRSTRHQAQQTQQTPASKKSLTKAAGTPQSGRKAAASPAAKPSKPQHAAKAGVASTQTLAHRTPRKSKASESAHATPTRAQAEPTTTNGTSRRTRAETMATPNGVPRRKSGRISEAAAKAEEQISPNGYAGDTSPGSSRKTRLKLTLGPVKLPYLHPLQAQPGDENSSFARWLEQDDPLAGDDFKKMTPQEIREEARLRLRILDAAEPGGVLSEERCSKYAIDAEEEPPPQYGPWDHIAAHACHFRKLLVKERREHMQTARRLAYECAEAWRARQQAKQAKLDAERPKTKEELEAEEKEDAEKRYKQLVKDLQQTWVHVKMEVDRRRHERWIEEQEALGKQTMKSLLHQSTALLKERRNMAGSPQSSDDEDDFESFMDEDDEEDGETESRMASTRPASSMAGRESRTEADGETGVDSEVMSSDDSDEDGPLPDDDDANLTQEQLREKYANIQLPDLWSSEEEDDQEKDEYEEEDDEDDEPGLASLLTNGHAEKSKDSSDQENDSVMDESKPNGIDPAAVELEEVDDILMDDEDDDPDMNMDSDSDDGSGTEEDDEEDEDASEAEEDDALGTWGFLSAQEIADLKKKAAEQVENGEDVLPAEDEGTPAPSDDPALAEDVAPESTENGPQVEPSESTLDREPATVNSVNGVSEAPSPPKEITVANSMEDVQPSEDVEQADEEPVEEMEEVTSNVKTPVPALFRGKLRPYQHEGLDWLAGLYNGDTNGILADEMGLGKTIQTIALLAHLAVEKEVWGPHLVVVPTSVMLNWEMEFKKFCPGFKVLAYYGSIEERKRKRQGWMNDDMWNVVITSYQLILHDAAAFKKRGWHYLILDEAHNIKNFQTQRWQTLLTFKTAKRLLLTGTPLQNNLQELWSLLFFLMPSGDDGQGGFAALSNFTTAMARPANQILDQGRQELDAEAQATVKQLHEVLRPYLLRRLKADVEKQMPGKYEHVVYCRLSKRQRQLYDGFMSRADTRQILSGGNYMSIMNCLMSLRKVCNHPDLFETRQIVTSFAMKKSVVADFEIKDLLVRKRLLQEEDEKVDLDWLNLNFANNEGSSAIQSKRIRTIQAIRPFEGLIERQTRRLKPQGQVDGTSVTSVSSYIEDNSSRSILEHLQNCLRTTRQRAQRKPIYGRGLVERLTINNFRHQMITSRGPRKGQHYADWYMNTPTYWEHMTPNLEERSDALHSTVQKFSCITPAVVANDLPVLTLGDKCAAMIRSSRPIKRPDPFHESRVRLSIAFPDKRLLQYDCGKLQRLEKLLRELQAGGHRALIFTQMTKVLDILEQFLNIHGHRYLRLDGATKIEQRQILTDRFNNDPRILCFILSSRSGGLGINLTGADTVIFYDLDWNPAMDKQCQDRCHRIGQTRDVHIYRFVSEYTIEANILRKSNQKRLLDDVIIQKGDFTTDYFNRLTYKDALEEIPEAEDAEASAAMDRVLGNMGAPDSTGLGPVLEGIEDKEDTEAAKVAQKEIVTEVHIDDADFDENASRPSATPKASMPPTPAPVADADQDELPHVDEYMVKLLEWEMRDIPLGPPPDKRRRKSRKGQEHRVRRRR